MDIEGIAMDREVMKLRNMLSPIFAEIVYNGSGSVPKWNFYVPQSTKVRS
jgi:argininosuccinate synthase